MNSERPKTERASWIAGIVSAVLAAAALVYSIWPRSSSDNIEPKVEQSASSVGTQIGAVGGNVTVINATPPPNATSPGVVPGAVVIPGPLGAGGVEYAKFIRDAQSGPGAKFFAVKCRVGNPVDVLYESHAGNKWYLVPPSEPEDYYAGTSADEFAKAACTSPSGRPERVLRIEPGIGATASGIRSFEITCRDRMTYKLQRAPDGAWFMLDGSASFSRYTGTEPAQFAALFCADR